MSDGIKLNQGVVTSLANTDLVVAADNGGSLRPISFANLMQLIRDNIQVGGRNLLKNTAGNHTNIEVSATDYGWWTPTVKLKEGVVYTMSFECDDDLTGGVLNLRESDKNHFDPTLKKGANNRYYGTMAWKSGDLFGGFTLGLWLENKTLRNIKLEQGNIPTDWSPAPEDSWGG